MGVTLRFLAFLLLAGLVAALWFALSRGGQGNPATADLRLTPPATELHWPDTIRGAPLLTPTPALYETFTTIRTDAPMPGCVPPEDELVTPPKNFPAFPFPANARYYKSALLNDNPNYILVAASVPIPLSDSIRYLVEALPRAGFVMGNGDSEPGEAESAFANADWRGGFRLNSMWDCDSASDWVVVMMRK